ncbi:MAG: tetraacyldisaccharide 4'-kinase [Spirochaetota bacterium]|nr:tetraacyldisaccharide 4'-kinase [Spirochaetota bacterium]
MTNPYRKLLQNVILPFSKYFRLILIPLVPIYLLLFNLKKKIASKATNLDIPVLCIGNITTGGSGKTPAVILVAQLLQEAGYNPAIVSRGYRGNLSARGALVSDGVNILLDPDESGDEPNLLAMRLNNIPISIGKNRKKAILELLFRINIDIILMDDGFQNNSVHKDISIITIDASNPFGNGLILPAGDLREPKNSLRGADIVLITKFDLIPEKDISNLVERVKRLSGRNTIFMSKYNIDFIYQINHREIKRSISSIAEKKVLLIAGIANTNAFLKTVKRYNPSDIRLIAYPDHYKYNLNDLNYFIALSAKYDFVIVTEKDYVKLKRFRLNDKFYALRISMIIEEADYFREYLMQLVNKVDIV